MHIDTCKVVDGEVYLETESIVLKLHQRRGKQKWKGKSIMLVEWESMDMEKCAPQFNVIFVIYQNFLMEYYTFSGHYYKENSTL